MTELLGSFKLSVDESYDSPDSRILTMKVPCKPKLVVPASMEVPPLPKAMVPTAPVGMEVPCLPKAVVPGGMGGIMLTKGTHYLWYPWVVTCFYP